MCSAIAEAEVAFIVLGCTVKPDLTPSDWLKARLEACVAAVPTICGLPQMTLKPFCVIVTGGAVRSVISEAACMSTWLEQNARDIIPQQRLVLEEQAQDTLENFVYSVALLKQFSSPTKLTDVVIVSNDFHIERAEKLFALEAGLQGLHAVRTRSVAAPTPGLEGERLAQRKAREVMLCEENIAAHYARANALKPT